jgi:hypothetical protein
MADDFDYSQFDQHPSTLAAGSIAATHGVSPQQAAVGIQAGPAAGLPPAVAMRVPEQAQQQAQAAEQQQVLAQHPGVAKWVAQADPAHVAVAKDDLGALARVNMTWGQYWGSGGPFGDVVRAMGQAAQQGIAGRQQMAAARNPVDWAKGALNVAGAELANAGSPFAAALEPFGQLIYKANVAAGDKPAAALRYAQAGKLLAGLGVPESEAAAGRGLSSAGAAGEAGEAAPAFVPPHQPTPGGNFATTSEGVVADAAGQPVHFPDKRSAAAWALKNSTEGQTFTVGRNGPGGTRFVEDIGPRGGLGGFTRGGNAAADEVRAAVAEGDAASIQATQAAVADSQTFARSPATMEDFLESQAPGHTTVLDPETVIQLGQQGHQPFPELAQQAVTSALDGTPLEVPTSRYVSATAGQPFADALNETSVFRDEGVSVAEGKEIGKQEPAAEPAEGEEQPKPFTIQPEVPADFSAEEGQRARDLSVGAARAIEEAASQQYLKQLFADPKAAGMSDTQFARYQSAIDDALHEAGNKLMERVYGQIRREREPDWKEAVERHTAAARTELEARPDVQAMQQLSEKGFKLNRDLVSNFYPEPATRLPDGILHAKGNHPDNAADLVGYPDGASLVYDLAALNDEIKASGAKGLASWLNKASASLGRQRAEGELGEGFYSPVAMRQLAMEIVPDQVASRLLIPELEALARQLGTKFDRKAIESYAAERFEQLPAKLAANPRKFAEQVFKLGERAEKMLLKGNHEDAFRHKQAQYIQRLMLKSSYSFQRMYQRTLGDWAKLAKRKTSTSIAQTYLDAIHQELGARGYRVPTANAAWNYEQWANMQRALGEEVRPEIEGTLPKVSDVGNLSAALFQELHWRIESLKELGRELNKVQVGAAKADLDALKQEVLDQGLGNQGRLREPPTAREAKATARDTIANRAGQLMDESKKVERLLNELDNYNPNGVFNRVLMGQMRDAAGTYSQLEHDWLADINTALGKLSRQERARWATRVPEGHGLLDPMTGREAVLDVQDLIGAFLHRGSEKGVWHLGEGGWGWDLDHLDRLFAAHLTPADTNFVTELAATFEKRWPQIVSVEKELTKLAPERAKTAGFTLPDGREFDGWYWHQSPDVRWWKMQERTLTDPEELTRTKSQLVSTPKGHTIRQTWASYPASLDWHGVMQHQLGDVAKRIAYGPLTKAVNKFLRQPEVVQYISHFGGPNALREINSWLTRQVGFSMIDPRAPDAMSAVVRALRMRTYQAMTTFNLAIGLEHATSVAQTAAVVGLRKALMAYPAYTWNAATAFLDDHVQPGQFVEDSSSYMAARGREANRELRDMMQMALQASNGSLVGDAYNTLARKWPSAFLNFINQEMVAKPTWWYNYQLARQGKAMFHGKAQPVMDHEAAVRFADKVVGESHGSGMELDMSTLHSGKGNEFLKLGTMFGVFSGTKQELIRGGLEMAMNEAGWQQKLAGLKQLLWAALGTTFIAKLVTDQMPKKRDNPLDWTLDTIFEGMAGIVPFGSTIYWTGHTTIDSLRRGRFEPDVKYSSVESTISNTVTGVVDAAMGLAHMAGVGTHLRTKDKRAVQNVMTALGFLFLAPTGQMGKTAQAAADLIHQPHRVQRPAHALVFGPTHERP